MASRSLHEVESFLLAETGIILAENSTEITSSVPLADTGYDSMSFVSLLISVEKKYGIKLVEKGLNPEDMKTLKSLAERIISEG
jgi:acyl carrier protein